MRPYTEYADRMYIEVTGPAHIVPWGTTKRALCGHPEPDEGWFGTGDWHETEHAAWLQLCHECHSAAYPENARTPDADPAVAEWHQALN